MSFDQNSVVVRFYLMDYYYY